MSSKIKSAAIPDAVTYKELVDQLAILTDATNQLATVENNVQTAFATLVDEHRQEYAILQCQITESEAIIRGIAETHPEWFEAVKTVKTPYGSVGFRAGTKLEVPNEELTLALLETKGDAGKIYLRERKFLNLEALETLTDEELAALRIFRVTADKCTVTPAKIDLGKAVKKAATPEPVEA